MKKYLILALSFITIMYFIVVPTRVFAHQPRITVSNETIVPDPEISKAYYGQLTGDRHYYRVSSDKPFDFYVNSLVPDIEGQKKDIIVFIIKIDKESKQHIATLDGSIYDWKKFHEPFANDDYWMGPEYKIHSDAGEYEIQVTSENNDSKYSLAIGEKESFNLKETINAINLIPKIKKNFFNESPVNFIFSPFGIGYILIMFIIAFIFGFIYRFILRKFAKNSIRGVSKNINKNDRIIRAFLSIILLASTIFTSWSAILIFFSGFCLFEAIFSWCGFYAALGKNTYPIE
jgi:hypothetical protein